MHGSRRNRRNLPPVGEAGRDEYCCSHTDLTEDGSAARFDDDLDVIADALSITIFKNDCAQNVPKEDEKVQQ